MAVLASFTHRMRRRAAHVLVGLGLSIGFAVGVLGIGCAQAPPPAAPKPCDVQIVTLRIYAADNINPNENQNPRSVVIRLYQLKDEMRLQNASYDEVLLTDKEILGDDIASQDEVVVFPNDLVEVKFERVKEASVLAGVALFHSPKGQSWKTFYTFPLKPGEAQCAGRGGDAGPIADPQVSFFVESTKLDNGSEFDESMFPNATSVRKVNLPKKSSEGAPKAASSAP
ncbi:MAG TPA: type VI secretion system lipoprotein TssJ [Polyangium sp.]|jgi:type VI secretion system protein VasD|nr:type VI secretion system lipoprotein TssJ [Polyangium sp.]